MSTVSKFVERAWGFIDRQFYRFFEGEVTSLEWALLGLSVALLLSSRYWISSRWFFEGQRRFHAFAQHRTRAILTAGLLPMLLRALLLPIFPIQPPSVHDEFSHLLLADTLVSGRLANPPHPFWQHFESIHIIQQPTYSSMYPPAHGAFLAFGQLLTGVPWIGIWLSVGLMGMGLCWMMQAWLPPAWALGGALVTMLQIGIASNWMNGYIGGAAPALGGALVMGAWPRLQRAPRPLDGLLYALGVVLLVNSRPMEGTIMSVVVALLVLFSWWRTRPRTLIQAAVPACLVIGIGAAATGYYNWRVTGNPTRLPYVVNRETYGWPENLAILPAKQLHHRDPVLDGMYQIEVGHRKDYSTVHNFNDTTFFKASIFWRFYIGPALTPLLLFLPWVWRQRKLRSLFWLGLGLLSLNLLQLMLFPQHVAVLTGIIYVLLTAALRQAYVTARRAGRDVPVRLMAAVPLCLTLTFLLKLGAEPLGFPMEFWDRPYQQQRDRRAAIEQMLSQRPGPQLVFVHYSPGHSPHEEWVYNRADIDHSKIVWAREVDPESDRRLRAYFADRQAWVVEADRWDIRLIPLPAVRPPVLPTSSPKQLAN